MKAKILVLVIVVAMMTMIVGLTSCSKDDDGVAGEMTSDIVGTWMCNQYYLENNYRAKIAMYDGDGCLPTTVTLNANGKCSGSGMVINGQGTFTVKTGNGWYDGYWAIFNFIQDDKVVSTDTLKSFTNDLLTGEVRIHGYTGKTFIFTKQ